MGWGLVSALSAIDMFLPNAEEARRIAREPDLETAARALRGDGPRPVVAVKRGADGAVAIDADGAMVDVPGQPADPVDSTGAGDAFDAGFLAAWLDGGSVREALALGAVCGALSTRGLGGTDGQPTRAEADAALAAWSPV